MLDLQILMEERKITTFWKGKTTTFFTFKTKKDVGTILRSILEK
jgi:hypothetical protein